VTVLSSNPETFDSIMQNWVSIPRLHHILPYESYDPQSQLFYNEGSTGFVLGGNPIVGANLEDQEQMAHFFRQQGNLNEGTSLQFLLFASPCIGPHLDYWKEARSITSLEDPIFMKLAERRAEFLKSKAYHDSEGLLIRDYRLLISYTVPGHITNPSEKDRILRVRKELKAVLETLGIYASYLDAESFIREVGTIANLSDDIYPHMTQWQEHDPLNKQIFDLDKSFKTNDSELLLNDGKTLCRTYIPKVWPKRWSLGNMGRMIGDALETRHKIPCPFLIHFGMFVDNSQGRIKAKAYAKRETLEKSMKKGLFKFVPNLREQFDESIEIAEEFQRGGQAIIESLSYTIFSHPDEIQENEQQLRNIWGSHWKFEPARYDHLFLFLSSFPMTWTIGFRKNGFFSKRAYGAATGLEKLAKAKKTVTKEAQNLLPLIGEWKGQATPGMPLVGRSNQLFFMNPFGKALLPDETNAQTDHNYNVSIAGAPGAGKSVLMNELMSTVMGVGGKVFVLDLGRSFKKSCQILGGRHIEFDVRYPTSLNPFSNIPEGNNDKDIEDREEMLATVCPIFQVMAAPKHGTSDLENAFIEQAIRWSWKKYGSKGNVDTVKEFLETHKDRVANHLGETLSSFASQGSYGHFFFKPADTNLKEKLIVIETDNLRSHPSLMAVVVQMLILQINQEMAKGDRKKPFLIIIDEAWKLLSGKNTASFISEATRTARKYKGSIITGTQHLTDYFKPESPGATEAFNCSAWKFIMYQESDVITSLKNHPQLQGFVDNEYKEALLRSIHSNPPHYSELAIFGPGINGIVGRLRLDPFSRLLYSTNPQEYQAIESLIASGHSIEEAIERVITQQNEEVRHAA
jgi:conjugal transfer ATP-binding protein TraC